MKPIHSHLRTSLSACLVSLVAGVRHGFRSPIHGLPLLCRLVADGSGKLRLRRLSTRLDEHPSRPNTPFSSRPLWLRTTAHAHERAPGIYRQHGDTLAGDDGYEQSRFPSHSWTRPWQRAVYRGLRQSRRQYRCRLDRHPVPAEHRHHPPCARRRTATGMSADPWAELNTLLVWRIEFFHMDGDESCPAGLVTGS